MTEKTAWADLPNAEQIDWIIASTKENPKLWYSITQGAVSNAVWDITNSPATYSAQKVIEEAGMNDVLDAAKQAGMDAAWNAGMSSLRSMMYGPVCHVITALIAYDDCAYMIKSSVEEIRMLAKLGDTRAMLLLPACIIFNEIKDID
jgi:hypothetical protein